MDEAPLREDVLADVLGAALVRNVIYRRIEASAPWGLALPKRTDAIFYIVARGGFVLELERQRSGTPGPRSVAEGRRGGAIEKPKELSAGDVVLLPHGTAHTIRDSKTSPVDNICTGQCSRAANLTRRIGGDGARSSIVCGFFERGPGRTPALLEELPRTIIVDATESQQHPAIAATVQLIIAESAAPGPASVLVLQRLADVLLVQTLRALTSREPCKYKGLPALSDPPISDALQLLHQAVWRPWTVELLAKRVGLSRSAFAARFHELVGEPPLQYLARWRMSRAAELLRTTDDGVAAIAARVGYESLPSFTKAFKRWQGASPAAFRITSRAAPAPSTDRRS
ncbi:MAG TPA: AraC family transcriptional regulator [Kofleriaceae bacterium]|jgi:AraC-like DNA-binding protein